MSRILVGEARIRGQYVRVLEDPVDTLQPSEASPSVVLELSGLPGALDLDDVRRLRGLLAKAESRLLLRHDQAARARNGVLDLD